MTSMFIRTRVILLIAVAAFLLGGGAAVVFGLGVLRASGDTSMTEQEIADMMEQLEAARELGFISLEGRTGRIKTFEDGVLTLNTPLGNKEALVGEDTVVQRTKGDTTETLETADLRLGVLVTIVGPTREQGSSATAVEVVPEGKDGFQIEPSDGGPSALPVFP